MRSRARSARKFVQADCHCLAQIHGDLLGAGGNAHQPVTVAEILVGEAALFRTEQQGDAARAQLVADKAGARRQSSQRLFRLPVTARGGADDECAVGHRLRDTVECFGASQQPGCAYRRPRLAERQFVRLHQAQVTESEIAHGSGGRADVQRIARGYQHYAQAVEFVRNKQRCLFYLLPSAFRKGWIGVIWFDTLSPSGANSGLGVGEPRASLLNGDRVTKEFSDHFAKVAANYAGFRPTYPPALFEWLAGVVAGHDLAWDCACGSGQASFALADYFRRVVATDASPAQIASAPAHSRIEFRVAGAEASGLADHSVDLITVAQALHWFDLDRFYAEARRVAKPGGLLAAWTYGVIAVQGEEVNACMQSFYRDTIGPYWPPERTHVEDGYRSLPFPFPEIPAPSFDMTARWTLAELLGYLRSWSATVRYVAARGFDPAEALEQELAPRWGGTAYRREVRWPLSLRAGRM